MTMIDEEKKIKEIIHSLINFTFEYDIEEVISKLELKEVSTEELEKLSPEERINNFKQGIFKIKLSDDKIIDINTVNEYCKQNKISNPIVTLSPDQKYLRYDFNEDLIEKQLKEHIRQKLSNSSKLNLDVLQKTLVKEKLKNKPFEGFISGVGLKTSSSIKEGKLYMQASCDEEHAYELISFELDKIRTEEQYYIEKKIKKNRRNLIIYIIFISIVLTLWIINNNCKTIPNWLSTSIGIALFLVSFIVMRYINHSEIKLAFNRHKAEKKYRKDFYDNLNDN